MISADADSIKFLQPKRKNIMKQYVVKRVLSPNWSSIPSVTLQHTQWLSPCPISASAQLCHDGKNLYVRMEAVEEHIRAQLTDPLDQVCEDSCLEFFFAPREDDLRYFNFEFNPLGSYYIGFGLEPANRCRQFPLNPEPFTIKPYRTENGWGITYTVPGDFIRLYVPEFDFTGFSACNFYKCGEFTEVPHYLSWAPMSSQVPQFHCRRDFARLIFE